MIFNMTSLCEPPTMLRPDQVLLFWVPGFLFLLFFGSYGRNVGKAIPSSAMNWEQFHAGTISHSSHVTQPSSQILVGELGLCRGPHRWQQPESDHEVGPVEAWDILGQLLDDPKLAASRVTGEWSQKPLRQLGKHITYTNDIYGTQSVEHL